MSNENKNPIDKVIDVGKNIAKSAGKDYWNRSFTKYVSKYPKLKNIPGLEYLSKTNPKLAEYNTKDFKILFEGLVGAESSYRKTVNKDEKTQYKGWYALPYKNNEKELLDDDNYQHTKAFKHFVNNSAFRFTKEDFARAKQLGYSEDEFIAMTWNNGSNVLNYLYSGDNPKDDNNTTLDKYVGMYRSHRTNTSNLNFTQVVPYASENLKIPIKPGDIYDKKQLLIRHYGRVYSYAGGDLFKGNPKDSVRIMIKNGLRAGETLDLTGFERTPPKSSIPYTKGGYPQNDNEFKLMMNDLKTIINNSNVKKFGGKLRYGWGGIYSPDDLTPAEYITGEKGNSGSGHHSARYYVDKGYQSADNLYTYRPGEGYVSYNNMTDEEKDNVLSGWDDWAVDNTINGFPLSTKSVQRLYKFDDKSLAEIESKRLKSINIFNNMQDRINKDIAIHRQVINANQIAKYGGLIGFRRRYDTGGFNYNTTPYSGNLSWGMKVKPEDISYSRYNADNESIYGKNIANYASSVGGLGMGLGTTIGLASGAGMAAAGPIGLAIGALLGAGIGALVGKNEKKNLEEERRNKLAELDELNRQQTLNSMQNRYENDVARIRTFNNNMSFNNSGFYTKYGGLIKPRIKYANGGTILPNSSDTAIAYGRTHEQVDPMTGETGITYGNAEVEGGGLVGNKELPGEVIQQTPNGDRIYSDSLYVPGTRATYAQIAKALTDKKGVIEQEISTLQETLDTSLDAFNKAKLAKAKTGTATRNIEKLAAKLNLKTGELAQVDAQLNDVFASQEQMATTLGLRDITPITARFGGYRPKYKFGIPEVGLLTNGLSFIGNMITTGLSSKNNLAQLDFLSGLPVPKTNKVEAEYYTIDTSPYEEASRKMAAETKRFNKWIEDNVSNPQVLRNQKRKNLINYYESLSDINAKKSAYLTSRYDANRNARIVARNTNNQGKYQDSVNEYNKNMQIANARMSINNQTTQNYMASINQLMKAVGSYGNQKMYLASLPEGVQKEFYFGRRRTRLPEQHLFIYDDKYGYLGL